MGASPLAAMLIPQMIQRMRQGGGGMQGPAIPGAPNPEAVGAAVRQEHAELQNVDPGKIVEDLKQHKEAVSALFPLAVSRVPDAAKGISQAVTGLNAAVKAFEKAQATAKAVGPALGLSAAQQNPQQNPLTVPGGTSAPPM